MGRVLAFLTLDAVAKDRGTSSAPALGLRLQVTIRNMLARVSIDEEQNLSDLPNVNQKLPPQQTASVQHRVACAGGHNKHSHGPIDGPNAPPNCNLHGYNADRSSAGFLPTGVWSSATRHVSCVV